MEHTIKWETLRGTLRIGAKLYKIKCSLFSYYLLSLFFMFFVLISNEFSLFTLFYNEKNTVKGWNFFENTTLKTDIPKPFKNKKFTKLYEIALH